MVALFLAAALSSQSPCLSTQPGPEWVCVNGGWLPPSHPNRPVSPPPLPVECDPVPNAYLDPDRASACAAATLKPVPATLPRFEVGRTYQHAYPDARMVVLSIARSLEGVPVITAQYIAHSNPAEVGQVFAFRVDRAQPWLLEREQ